MKREQDNELTSVGCASSVGDSFDSLVLTSDTLHKLIAEGLDRSSEEKGNMADRIGYNVDVRLFVRPIPYELVSSQYVLSFHLQA